MKKLMLTAVITLALLAGGVLLNRPSQVVHAQNAPTGLTMGTTVTANTFAGTNYFYLLVSGGNVTTFNLVCQSPAVTPVTCGFNPGVVTIVFQQDGTGSRTVGFGTMFATAVIPTLNSGANKFTVMQFFYDSASGLWFPLSSVALHN